MNASLAHRGPDGDGFFADSVAALGHRRLAIIDRAGGQQPISNEDGSCWIIFNGEVYNHRSLRSLLEAKGHRFRTNSDTEAIVHAWEEFGTGCVERLEGMFAFVIYDSRRRELFAARDRLGKKPFFYTAVDGAFHFASELLALTRSSLWRGDVDVEALESYFALGYFLAPSTIYRDVFKLMPGHWLHIREGRIQVQKYWDIQEFDTDRRPQAELVADIDRTLRTAVHDRLESEVPLGAFLSGGIDSGLIVSYMAEVLGDRLITASIGFDESSHNELDAANLTARHFKSQHYPQVILPRLDDVMARVIEGLGEPMADSSVIPTWYVSKAARQHVTVALSGDGGDESFAGYDFRYVPHAIEASARRLVPGGRSPAAGWLGARWPRWQGLPKPLRVRTILENLSRDSAGAYYADLTFLKHADVRALVGQSTDQDPTASRVYDAVTAPYRQCPSDSPVQRSEYADLKVYLPNDPLVKVDRMSMAHGLEVRCPLLDHRVVELAFRIPASQKQVGWNGKVLLRELARQRLPGELWRLPKHGFSAPVREWIAGPQGEMFEAEVLRPQAAISAYVDHKDLGRRFTAHRRHQDDQSTALWAVWVLERWLQQHAPMNVGQ